MGGRSGGGGRGGGGAAGIIAAQGGVLAGDYSREGFRPLDLVSSAFRGATREQAQAIATGKRDVMVPNGRETRLPPIRVAVETYRNGKSQVFLIDGRHRTHVAKSAGATHIRAHVRHYRETKSGDFVERGQGGWGGKTTIVKL